MTLQEHSVSRRTAMVGAGAAAVGLSVAACGSSSTTADSTTTAAPGTVLAKVADVPVGGGVIVGDTVVTQPTAGVYTGLSSICTHQGCKVDRITNGEIECPCHFSKFRLDGTVVSGPAPRPLPARPVKVDGDNIVSA